MNKMSGYAISSGVSSFSGIYKKKAGALSAADRNKRKKKKLSYNPREISGQLIRAARSAGASEVLVRARGKVELLLRCKATGQYDDKEVEIALIHARQLVKCAQTKVKNLKNEEQLQKSAGHAESNIKGRNRAQILSKVRQQEQRELQWIRSRHRSEENDKIQNADRRYYSALMRHQQEQEKNEKAAEAAAMTAAMEAAAMTPVMEAAMTPEPAAGISSAGIPAGAVSVDIEV